MPVRLATLVLILAGLFIPGRAHAGSISFLHTPPAQGEAGLPVHITGNVFGAGELARAHVFYRRPGGRFTQVELRPAGGDEYEAVIPGRDVKAPAIEYYVVAVDLLGRRSDIFASESNPQSIAVSGDDDDASDEAKKPQPNLEPVDAGAPEAKPKPDEKPRELKKPKPEEVVDAGEPAKSSELEQELAMYGAEDVVSLATKHEQVVSDAPAIASSLSDEEMRQLAVRTVPDALKLMPGFDISRDVAGFTHIAVRGLRADSEVLVLYDGHAINSPYDGRPLIDLPTDNLERVEVVRGPGSALYGTGAFLGAVNLVPKRRDEVAATFGVGSFNTLEGAANVGHTWGGLSLHLDGAVDTTKGYAAPVTSDFNSASLEAQGLKASDDAAGTVDDHHTVIDVGGEARAETPGGTIAISARYLSQSRGALLGLYDTLGPGSSLDWNVGLADLTWNKTIGDGSISARLLFDQQHAGRLYQLTPAHPNFSVGGVSTATGLQAWEAYTSRTFGGELSGEVALHPTNRLEVGLSVQQQSLPDFAFETNYTETNGVVALFPGLQALPGPNLEHNPDVNRRDLLGVYVQDQWRPVTLLSLTLGVRLDAIQLPTVTG